MQALDYATVVVDGQAIDAWQSYTFESDMFTPADACRLSLGVGTSDTRALRKRITELRDSIFVPGKRIELYVTHGGITSLQATCVVDARNVENDAESGTTFTVEGRDLASYLVDDSAPPELFKEGVTLMEVAREAVKPWGLSVRTDATGARDIRTGKSRIEATPRNIQDRARDLGIPAASLSRKILEGIDNGTIDPNAFATSKSALATKASGISSAQIAQLKIKQAAPHSGESRWEFLDRHARRMGVLMRMGPDGTLNLSTLDYGQAPSYRLVRKIRDGRDNNIVAGGERYDTARLYSDVRVMGKMKGKNAIRSNVDVRVSDFNHDALPHEKVLLIHDSTVRTVEQAEGRAWRELAKSRQGARLFSYTVLGHGMGGRIFAADTVAHVQDEVVGINQPLYVVSRTLTRSESAGPVTTLRMVPLESIVLGEP